MKTLPTVFPLIISNTDMNLISTCPLKWFRVRAQHLTRPRFNIDLSAGGEFAKGLEVTRKLYFDEGCSKSDSVEIGKQTIRDGLNELIAKAEQEDLYVSDKQLLKSPERMAVALGQYFKKFSLDDGTYIPAKREDGSFAFEHTFTTELPILHPELNVPLIFKGKLDLIQKFGERFSGVDDKTTSRIQENLGTMLMSNGQFLGYAWLARKHGIKLTDFRVRKVSIQVNEIKIPDEYIIPMTDYVIKTWEEAFLHKIKNLVEQYKSYLAYLTYKNTDSRESMFFIPDYGNGCNAYNKPCQFITSCTNNLEREALLDIRSDGLGKSDYRQLVYEKESGTSIELTEYRELLGLDNE